MPALTAKSATDATGTAQRLQAALGRRASDPAKRRYLGVYDVRSEEIGRHLDPVAESLRAVIEYELSQNPDVLVLDREDLRRMTDEKYLADLPVALKISTTLLTCGVRRTDANGGLAATFALTPLGNSKALNGTLSGSSRDVVSANESGVTLMMPITRGRSPR